MLSVNKLVNVFLRLDFISRPYEIIDPLHRYCAHVVIQQQYFYKTLAYMALLGTRDVLKKIRFRISHGQIFIYISRTREHQVPISVKNQNRHRPNRFHVLYACLL